MVRDVKVWKEEKAQEKRKSERQTDRDRKHVKEGGRSKLEEDGQVHRSICK